MLNPVAVEALYSATYVENYLDAVENLPDEISRFLTRIREIDVRYRSCLRDVDNFYEQWANCPTNELESSHATRRTRAMTRIQQSLITAQELGDEKLNIVQQLQDLIDQKTRQLDLDFKNLDYGRDEAPGGDPPVKDARVASPPSAAPLSSSTFVQQMYASAIANAPPATSSAAATSTTSATTNSTSGNNGNGGERSSKRARRTRIDAGSAAELDDIVMKTEPVVAAPKAANTSTTTASNAATGTQKKTAAAGAAGGAGAGGGKKKRKKTGRNSNQGRDVRDDTPPPEEAIDPDEPTYCLCDQISFGEMILCDNDLCPIEWFHFSCVSLMSKPKGKWFCPNCRGDRPNVMKPKAQFLKELEQYNKAKEEKT